MVPATRRLRSASPLNKGEGRVRVPMRREQVEIANPLTSRLRVTTAWQASLSRFAKGRRESAAIQSYSIAQAPPLLCYGYFLRYRFLRNKLRNRFTPRLFRASYCMAD